MEVWLSRYELESWSALSALSGLLRKLADGERTCSLPGMPATSQILCKADHLLRADGRGAFVALFVIVVFGATGPSVIPLVAPGLFGTTVAAFVPVMVSSDQRRSSATCGCRERPRSTAARNGSRSRR